MPKLKDITGQKFNRLTAVCFDHRNIHGQAVWKFACDCGNRCVIASQDVRSGHTKSCGCYNKERAKFKHRTHGMRKSPVYDAWNNMRRRCADQKNGSYDDYGGRGITVCDRWSDCFENFYEDMGQMPVDGMELDRIDNELGYSKENCRWSTEIDQANNKRSTIKVAIYGQTLPLAVLCRRYGLNYHQAYGRIITKGRGVEETIKELKGSEKGPPVICADDPDMNPIVSL